MQTTQESNNTAPIMNQPRLVVMFTAWLENKIHQRSFDLATHSGRVEMSKFIVWAANHKLPLQISHL